VEDVEPFIAWLRSRGTPEAHLDAHRHYAAELAKHPSLSAALRAGEEEGVAANRLANLRQTAARLAEYEDWKANPDRPERPERPERVTATPPAPIERSARVTAALKQSIPRKGCACTKHYDVYLDNDFGSLARWLGGGIGIGTIILIRMFGLLGALAIGFALAGLGGFATIFTVALRCEGCRLRVSDLDEDERTTLRKARALVTLVTLGLLAAAVLCGVLWWMAVTSRSRLYQ
jgi:hypothetical protein